MTAARLQPSHSTAVLGQVSGSLGGEINNNQEDQIYTKSGADPAKSAHNYVMRANGGLRTPNASGGGSAMGLSADGTLAGRGYTHEQKKLFHSRLDAITQKGQQRNHQGQNAQYGGQGYAT